MRTKTIKQVGIIVKGTSTLVDWGNSVIGDIEMKPYFLPNDKITPKNILRCVNDNGFGCMSIASAEIDIYIKYDNGSEEMERTLYADSEIHSRYFLGWRELRKQGIN